MLAAAILTLLLTLGTTSAEPPAGEPIPDCCAAKLTWTDLSGREQKLDAYRGRYVVLNFWATWCQPCREEMPALVKVQNRYGIHGVQVVGASADAVEKRDEVLALAREFELNFPVLLGANIEQMNVLGLGDGIPATVIVDPDGRIVERFDGLLDSSRIEKVLDDLVGAAEPVRVAAVEHGRHDGHDHEHGGAGASLVPS
jgi:thiol-disulfide isomerase/thioredoxin